MDRSKRPAPEPYIPTTGPTMLHPLPVTFPNLTSANCCPHAARLKRALGPQDDGSKERGTCSRFSNTSSSIGVRSGAALFLLRDLHRAP
jgi:hypothetical protein